MKRHCTSCGREYEVHTFIVDDGTCMRCGKSGARRLLYAVAMEHVVLLLLVSFTTCTHCVPPAGLLVVYGLVVTVHSLFRALLSFWRPFRLPAPSRAMTNAYLLLPLYGGPLFIALFCLARILRYGKPFY